MANAGNNRVSATMSQQDLTDVKSALDLISSKLPFLIGLNESERKHLPKINRDNKLFVEDALMVGKLNPTLLPSFVDIVELQKDLDLYRQLSEIILPLSELFSSVRDTQMQAGSEAYSASLAIYRMTTMAAKAGVPGISAAYEKLSVRFENQGNSDTTDTETPPVPEE